MKARSRGPGAAGGGPGNLGHAPRSECPGVTGSVAVPAVGQHDPPALGPDAPGRRLKQFDDAQPKAAVADRLLAVADALGKVGDGRLKGFARLDVRAPHVPGPVAHLEPPP